MQNHGLGIHSDKIWAASSTKNTLEHLKTYSADLPNRSKYLGYLKEKKLSMGVRNPWFDPLASKIIWKKNFGANQENEKENFRKYTLTSNR